MWKAAATESGGGRVGASAGACMTSTLARSAEWTKGPSGRRRGRYIDIAIWVHSVFVLVGCVMASLTSFTALGWMGYDLLVEF